MKEKLTAQQYKAIQLALEGHKWGTIASEVGVSESALWTWRHRNHTFQNELRKHQESMLQETALNFNTYIQTGYLKLFKMANNANNEYDAKTQLEASKALIELPMHGIEKLKILEHNRRELEIEDELNKTKQDEEIKPEKTTETKPSPEEDVKPSATKKKPRSNRKPKTQE